MTFSSGIGRATRLGDRQDEIIGDLDGSCPGVVPESARWCARHARSEQRSTTTAAVRSGRPPLWSAAHDHRPRPRQPRDGRHLGAAHRSTRARRRRRPLAAGLRRPGAGGLRRPQRRLPRVARRSARGPARRRTDRPRRSRLGWRTRPTTGGDASRPDPVVGHRHRRMYGPRLRVARPRPGLADARRRREGRRGDGRHPEGRPRRRLRRGRDDRGRRTFVCRRGDARDGSLHPRPVPLRGPTADDLLGPASSRSPSVDPAW